MSNAGTKGERWRLKTPPLTSDYELYLDDKDETRAELIVIAGTPDPVRHPDGRGGRAAARLSASRGAGRE